MVLAAPLLHALLGHERLEEVHFNAFGGVLEEVPRIRVADMPSLRCLALYGLGNIHNVPAHLEMQDLPALEELNVQRCNLVALLESEAGL